MAKIKTSKGDFHYRPVVINLDNKIINRDIAFENLKVVVRVLRDVNIRVNPAFGTLLGIIRENNFIEWDTDIDLFVLSEDKEKLLESFWLMKDEGIELIRVDRCGHLFTVMRNDEYIDFYIMDKISPEIRTNFGETFMFEKYLTDLIDWDYRGLTISVPREYEQCLEFIYGDWRTPIKYSETNPHYFNYKKAYIVNHLKRMLPYPIHYWLLKHSHRKDLDKFIAKCNKKNIKLQYEINW